MGSDATSGRPLPKKSRELTAHDSLSSQSEVEITAAKCWEEEEATSIDVSSEEEGDVEADVEDTDCQAIYEDASDRVAAVAAYLYMLCSSGIRSLVKVRASDIKPSLRTEISTGRASEPFDCIWDAIHKQPDLQRVSTVYATKGPRSIQISA